MSLMLGTRRALLNRRAGAAGPKVIGLGRNNVFVGTGTASTANTDTGGTSTKTYRPKGKASKLRALIVNERSTAGGNGAVEQDGFNAIGTVKVSAEYPLAGTLYPMQKDGTGSWSVPATGAALPTDALDLIVENQTDLRLRTYIAVTAPERYTFNSYLASAQESSNHASQSGDKTDKTGVTGNFTVTGPAGFFSFVPAVLVGEVVAGQCLLCLGDSISAGRGFTSVTERQSTRYSYFDQAIGDGELNSINASLSGGTDIILTGASAATDARTRLALLDYATAVLLPMIVNDLATLSTWQEAAVNKLTLAQLARSRGATRVLLTTCTPRVTTTDNGLTIAGQTKSAIETKRIAFNQWVRGGCQVGGDGAPVISGGTPSALITGYADLAGAVEVNASNVLTVDGGFWKVPTSAAGPYTLSGTPTTTSFTLVGTPLQKGLLTGQVIKMLTGARAGQIAVVSNNNIGTVTLYANGSTAQSGIAVTGLSAAPAAGDTFEVYDVLTNEGLHPALAGHTAMAAALRATLVAQGLI